MDVVTVVMATHNASQYLPEAVDSIRQQSFKNWRLIIVDDASTDSSDKYLSSLNDKRIHTISLVSNHGQGTARNIAIAQCESQFIAIMDADDISHPDRLLAQVDYLQRHPSVGVVGTQFQYLGRDARQGFGSPLPCSHEDIYANLLAGKHAIVNASAMFRASLLKAVGAYQSSRAGEDWDIFLRLGEASRLSNLSQTMYFYRVHDQSTSAQRLAQMRLQYAFAIHTAAERAKGVPEGSFEEFIDRWKTRPVYQKLRDFAEVNALANYRKAITAVLYGYPLTGYARLGLAAILAPSLTLSRLCRMVK